jgi:carotenoid 1,2-hydratase
LRGRQRAPGRGRADGGLVGAGSRARADRRPGFDLDLPQGGYAWWYVDAFSDDGRYGLTIIAFAGSVFSPYYASGYRAEPFDHAAINVALYGPKRRWTMTERGEEALVRDADQFTVGPSGLRWEGDTLVIELAETTPWLRARVKGTIRVHPQALVDRPLALGRAERHFWWPLAPCARIEVDLAEPALNWSGAGYLDMNIGCEPIENGFSHWDWSRATLKDGRTVVLYDLKPRDGAPTSLAVQFDPHAEVQELDLPAPAALRPTLWLMPRRTRADDGARVRVDKTYEDTPFYARTALDTQLFGERVEAMHESLSLDRLRSGIVQFMLPYRMPREAARRTGPRVPWPIKWRPPPP